MTEDKQNCNTFSKDMDAGQTEVKPVRTKFIELEGKGLILENRRLGEEAALQVMDAYTNPNQKAGMDSEGTEVKELKSSSIGVEYYGLPPLTGSDVLVVRETMTGPVSGVEIPFPRIVSRGEESKTQAWLEIDLRGGVKLVVLREQPDGEEGDRQMYVVDWRELAKSPQSALRLRPEKPQLPEPEAVAITTEGQVQPPQEVFNEEEIGVRADGVDILPVQPSSSSTSQEPITQQVVEDDQQRAGNIRSVRGTMVIAEGIGDGVVPVGETGTKPAERQPLIAGVAGSQGTVDATEAVRKVDERTGRRGCGPAAVAALLACLSMCSMCSITSLRIGEVVVNLRANNAGLENRTVTAGGQKPREEGRAEEEETGLRPPPANTDESDKKQMPSTADTGLPGGRGVDNPAQGEEGMPAMDKKDIKRTFDYAKYPTYWSIGEELVTEVVGENAEWLKKIQTINAIKNGLLAEAGAGGNTNHSRPNGPIDIPVWVNQDLIDDMYNVMGSDPPKPPGKGENPSNEYMLYYLGNPPEGTDASTDETLAGYIARIREKYGIEVQK